MIAGEASLTIPQEAWLRVGAKGDTSAVLHAVIEINGCPMHVEAIATINANGEQRGPTEETDATLDLLSTATGAGDPWSTVAIGDRRYVLFAAPFAE
jgi:hypothetical protein